MYPMDPGTRTLARSSFAVKVHIRRLFFSRAKSLQDKKFSSSAHIRRVHRLPQFLDNQCLVSQSPPDCWIGTNHPHMSDRRATDDPAAVTPVFPERRPPI